MRQLCIRIESCAPPSGYNAFSAQQLAPKSNLAFSGGSQYQPTFKSKWVGETDFILPWSAYNSVSKLGRWNGVLSIEP